MTQNGGAGREGPAVPTVRMLGTRGVPAAHGGFETAVENIGLELVARGWRVVVYCQDDTPGARARTDEWKGIERVWFPSRFPGAKGTMWFDAQAIRHAARHASRFHEVCVTFGYNTAMLNLRLRLAGVRQVINMDGIEWKRRCWSGVQRIFLYGQERAACGLGNALIADHPVIADHLATRVSRSKITTIAYGAPAVRDAPLRALDEVGLRPGEYLTLVARPVPENNILEMVRAFSSRRWGRRLVVVGTYDENEPYHRAVLEAAGDEVDFVGAIYDPEQLQALRFHSLAYLHGHQVGGTNPSLVEALGCGNPVIAHDNPYNRWVAGTAAFYVRDQESIVTALARVIGDPITAAQLSAAARLRHAEEFGWRGITDRYEALIRDQMRVPARRRAVRAPVMRPVVR